ncbi:protein-disulfide reductase DsbD family protein [Stygiobacter electus]|uniref:Protein-disulfide reductase DsbD n=1 Tax=Stygiobacter electus TaxID=3032292 RepID=A0AAE3P485_9BACT|nr:protein-disulfide reductase DsbD [Stygiobacter electus]MDF1612938.1 protein-disulfide reductase DsbD [Stygiobacter electus]
MKKLFSFLLLITNFIFAQIGNNKIVDFSTDIKSVSVQAGKEFEIKFQIKIQNGWHINSNKPLDEFLIASKVSIKDKNFELVKVDYPKAKEIKLEISDKPVSVFDGTENFKITLRTKNDLTAGEYKLPIYFYYQGCNNESCMPPNEVSTEVLVKVNGNNSSDQKLILNTQEPNNQESSTTSISTENKNENSIADTIENSGLLLSLIFVFLGGLALNLTPCVYPLIPITIGYFGGQAEGKTSRLFVLGLLYVLGMAITYSVIGVITSLSGAVFGTLLQNPFVIIGIALLFVILSLSQFGVYEFKLPDSLVMKAGGAKGGIFGAFFMGLTMGIVAAPCIGPFVLGLVTYVAAKGDPFYGFLMFFVLAIGLGLPYLLLALFSGKIKNLPRAGFWMDGVKHIFGFLLLGMAIYFLNPILPKSIQGFTLPIFGIIAIIILFFIDKEANKVKGFRIFKIIFTVVVLSLSVYALIPQKKLEPEWQKFSLEKFEMSKNNHEKMIIDFYADWCIPCKELDAITFSNEKVIEKTKEFTCYKVDMTKTMDEKTEQYSKKFSIVGMPTVLIIDSNGNEVERITGFVNPDEFLNSIMKAK